MIMKCLSCGAEIGLTVEKCPYCGRVVTETAGHQADLKSYREKSEKTKRGLKKVMSENVPIVISAVVMAVLLIACGVAFYVADNAYIFRSDAMRKESVKKYDQALLLITHDLTIAAQADIVYRMEDGRLTELENGVTMP